MQKEKKKKKKMRIKSKYKFTLMHNSEISIDFRCG